MAAKRGEVADLFFQVFCQGFLYQQLLSRLDLKEFFESSSPIHVRRISRIDHFQVSVLMKVANLQILLLLLDWQDPSSDGRWVSKVNGLKSCVYTTSGTLSEA